MPKFRTCCTWDHVTCGQLLTNITVEISTIACCSRLSLAVLDYCLLFKTIAYCSRLLLTVIDYRLSILDYPFSVLDYRMSVLDYRMSVLEYRIHNGLSYVRSQYTFVQFGLPYLGALNFSREMEPIEMRVSNLSIPASQTLINLSSIYRKNSAVLAQKASNRARCGMFALL